MTTATGTAATSTATSTSTSTARPSSAEASTDDGGDKVILIVFVECVGSEVEQKANHGLKICLLSFGDNYIFIIQILKPK